MHLKKENICEFVRFAIVGTIATAIHYLLYWLLRRYVYAEIAYTAGYAVSFAANFFLTTVFTFKTQTTLQRGLGFGLVHLINWLLQIVLLRIFLSVGAKPDLAPIPVFCIAIPVNFLMVRYVFKRIGNAKSNDSDPVL